MSDYLSLATGRKDIIVVMIILLSHGIYMNDKWEIGRNGTLDLDLVWHSSEARIAIVMPVSIEDRLLHWILFRSQTYYHEHILAYGEGKAHCSLIVGSSSF